MRLRRDQGKLVTRLAAGAIERTFERRDKVWHALDWRAGLIGLVTLPKIRQHKAAFHGQRGLLSQGYNSRPDEVID